MTETPAAARTRHAQYDMIVGLEVHVQLQTATKAFCRCRTTFGAAPNTNVCPVCLGMPGALPVLNAHAVALAARAAFALGCAVHARSTFARKNYFYPDLPKGYQITQFEEPLATGGGLDLADGHRIGITRVHIEEDAGKLVHDRFAGATAVDFNRAGVPLIEIVTEAIACSGEDAVRFLRALRETLVYADVSDCAMAEGHLRVDANVSARRRGEAAPATRTEIKNLNSFANTARALELEFARHCAVYDAGGTVRRQTMLFDDVTRSVRPARGKEESHDYRYFPEPDLPPLVLTADDLARARAGVPDSPATRRARYVALGLAARDADALTARRDVSAYFDRVLQAGADPESAARWVLGDILAARNAVGGDAAFVSPERLAQLIGLVGAGRLSTTTARTVYATMRTDPASPLEIAVRDGLIQVVDDATLDAWIEDVFAENPDLAGRFRAGERKLQGVLVGKVMAKSAARADPRRVAQLLAGRVAGR